MSKSNSGFLSLLSAAVILGTFGVWIRLLDQSFGNAAQVVVRSTVAALIISAIILFKKVNFQIDRKLWKYIAGFSVVFPLSLLAFTISANQIKVTNSLFMLYVGSLLATYLWGRFAFKEKLTRIKIISIILILIGLYFFVFPFSIDKLSIGLVMGIAAGLLEGSAHAFRKFMKDVPREIVVFFQSAASVVVALTAFAVSGEAFAKEITTTSIVVALIFGCALVAIGYLLFYGFNNFDVNAGAIILATELFFATIINAIFLQEIPSSFELIGGILIFIGATITSLNKDLFLSVFQRRK